MQAARALTAAVLTLAGLAAQASTEVTVQLNVNPNFFGGTGPHNTVLTQQGPAQLSSGLVTGGGNSSGTGFAYAETGILKVAGTSEGSLNSGARAIFRDEMQVDLPGVAAGTLVAIDFSLLFTGSLRVGNSNIAAASWQVRADIGGGAYDLGGDATLYNDSPSLGVHGYVGTPLGNLGTTVVVPTGFMMPVHVELFGGAQTSYDGHGGALATSAFDLSHTLRWGGMTVSLNGVPQDQVVLTSASGFNYLQAAPVPEPGTLVLALLGAAVVLSRRRFTAA